MKHHNTYYLQLSRLIFNEEPYKGLSQNAKWLYAVLKELEQRYTSGKADFFYRLNDELAADAGFSVATLKRAKAELVKTDLIQSWQGHFVFNQDTPQEKRSEKHVTYYRVLK